MPVEVKYLDGGIGFGLTVRKDLTGDKLIDAVKRFYLSEESLRKNKYGLVDYTPVENINLSRDDVSIIAELTNKASKIAPDRIVAVVASEDACFGLSRMWEMLSEESSWEKMIFRIKDDAEEWLKKRVNEKFNIDITLR